MIYIASFTSNAVMNIEVNGLILDTTWEILNNYVESLSTLIIQNMGMPIGLSFGPVEDFNIYNEFFHHFWNIYGYNISDFINVVESEQGKAHNKVVKD